MTTKQCTKCKLNLELIEFTKDKTKIDGLYPSCKKCKQQQDLVYRLNNSDKIKQRDKKYYDLNSDKICQRSNEWYKNNFDHASKTKKEWYRKNFDKVKEYRAIDKINRRDFYKAYMNEYIKNRYNTEPLFRLKCLLRSRLKLAMKKDYKKSSSIILLGCSIEYFKKWIEYQFDSNMNWNNHGGYWHLDHITPCSSFNLINESEQKLCFHWTNIRPLSGSENCQKSDKIDKELITKYKELSTQYELQFPINGTNLSS